MKYLTQIINGTTIIHHDYSNDYFKVTPLEDGCTCNITFSGSNKSVKYSFTPDIATTNWPLFTSSTSIQLNNKECYFLSDTIDHATINFTKKVEVSGNIYNFINVGDRNNKISLASTFANSTSIIYAHNLYIPNANFEKAFLNCVNLKTSPHINYTSTLADANCFKETFKGCTSLISGNNIEINSTKATNSSFESMFDGCTNLINSFNELTINDLRNLKECKNMFNNCVSLKHAPNLNFTYASTSATDSSTNNMFNYCNALDEVNIYDSQVQFKTNGTKAYTNIYCGTTIRDGFKLNFGNHAFNENSNFNNNSPISGTTGDYISNYYINTNLYANEYFTIENVNGTSFNIQIIPGIRINNNVIYDQYEIAYSKDNGKTWSYKPEYITFNQGEKIAIKGKLNINDFINNANNSSSIYNLSINSSVSAAKINVYGNILSLIYGDDFKNNYNLFVPYGIFNKLLGGNFVGFNIVDSKNLVLPFIDSNSSINYLLYNQYNQMASVDMSLPFICMPIKTSTSVFGNNASSCIEDYFLNCSYVPSSDINYFSSTTNYKFKSLYVNSNIYNNIKHATTFVATTIKSYTSKITPDNTFKPDPPIIPM